MYIYICPSTILYAYVVCSFIYIWLYTCVRSTVCMYVDYIDIYADMYVCMYVCLFVCLFDCLFLSFFVCFFVCVLVCFFTYGHVTKSPSFRNIP